MSKTSLLWYVDGELQPYEIYAGSFGIALEDGKKGEPTDVLIMGVVGKTLSMSGVWQPKKPNLTPGTILLLGWLIGIILILVKG